MALEASPIAVSVVVPVFDEEESLPSLDEELRRALSTLGRSSEILYVDDGSRDRSREVLGTLVAKAAGGIRTRVVHLSRNFGQTAALAAGFDLATGSVIVPLDADGQNDPADIPRLLAKLDEGYDVVSGWRRQRRDRALSRRLPSWVANWLIAAVSGLALHDYGCTMKAYRASSLHGVQLYGDMHRFIPAHMARGGARIAELEVGHRPRRTGTSKYGGNRIISVALDLVLIRFMTRYYSRPMQFFGHAAVLFLALGALTFSLMIVFKLGWLRYLGIDYQADFVQTPLPALAATFFLGMEMSLFFGVIGEVLIRIHHESVGRRPYAVTNVLDSAT